MLLTCSSAAAHILRYCRILRGNIEERACELAAYIIEKRTTVREAAKKFGVSKSTVHMVVPNWDVFYGSFSNSKDRISPHSNADMRSYLLCFCFNQIEQVHPYQSRRKISVDSHKPRSIPFRQAYRRLA